MLRIPQYPTYESLPSGSHGDLAEITTGGIGVYQFVGEVNQEPVGLWVPADLAGRLSDYVRRKIGLASAAIVSGGTGYAASDTVKPSGGTPAIDAIITVDSVDSGVITGASITTIGAYDVNPSPLEANPVTTVTGSGANATFDLTMQNQTPPVKISVGVGEETLADLTARGWFTFISGNGVTPVDVSGAIELDSGTTIFSTTGIEIAEILGVADTAAEYLLVSQTETTGPDGAARLYSALWGTTANKVIRQVYRTDTLEDTAEFTSANPSPFVPIGRNSLSFSAYETLFTRISNGPTVNTNAEISQIWTPSVGRIKSTPNCLLEEFLAASGLGKFVLSCINYVGGGGVVGRVRELHLFELS